MNAIDKAVKKFENAVRNHENRGMYSPENQHDIEVEYQNSKDHLLTTIAAGGHYTLKMTVWEFLLKYGQLELKGILDEAPPEATEFYFEQDPGLIHFFKGKGQAEVYAEGSSAWVKQDPKNPIIEPKWVCSIAESLTVVTTL